MFLYKNHVTGTTLLLVIMYMFASILTITCVLHFKLFSSFYVM